MQEENLCYNTFMSTSPVDPQAAHEKLHILSIQDLTLDTSKKLATIGSKKITLTKKESALLAYLIENKNKILTRKQILKKIWNMPSDIQSRTVDVYIGYLREKIDGGTQKRIHSIRGLGYMLKSD